MRTSLFLPLLLLSVQACQNQAPDSTAPPAPTRFTPAPPKVTAPPPPQAHAEPSVIPRDALKMLPALHFSLQQLKPQGPPLLQGGPFLFQKAAPRHQKALIGRVDQAGAAARSWSLLDLETGKFITSTYHRAQLRPKLGLLGVSTPTGAALVHLDDGTQVQPRVSLPLGHQVSRYQIFLDDAVWVVAYDQDDQPFAGHWRSTRKADLTLTQRLPFAPRSVQSATPKGADFVRGNGAPTTKQTKQLDCVRFRLDAQGQRCTERGVPQSYSPQSYHLGPDWTLWSPGGKQPPMLLHQDPRHNQELKIPACQKINLHAALVQPPRALVGCSQGGQGTSRTMLLWSPEQSWTWTEPPEEDEDARMMRTIGITKRPVLDGVEWDLERRSSTWWLDMQGGHIWTSPPMDPLERASVARDALVVLQSPPRLARVDFQQGTAQSLMPAPPCPGGELFFGQREGNRITLTCQVQRDPHLYVFTHQWTLVLDLDRHRAWRTSLYPEALLEDGSVLLSDRSASTAESRASFQTLHRIMPH